MKFAFLNLHTLFYTLIKVPKTFAGDRFIDFPDFVAEKLREKKERIVELNPMAVTHRFARMLKKLNIQHFRFHDLRHYSASIQHALGIPDAYIMQRGGWEDDTVLKSVYRHAMVQEQSNMNKKQTYISNRHSCNMKCNTNRVGG